MTPAKKFDTCLRMARAIVAAYRAAAPAGCDPQNSYVALATAVVGAGTAAYSSYSQKKKASEAAKAGASGGFQPINLPEMPPYIPVNVFDTQNIATGFDKTAYGLSDQDFKKRHAPIVGAEKLFQNQTLKDQQGESELLPAMQSEFLRSGMSGALAAFGDTPGTLAPGSAGEADVARNLGLSIAGFQDRNRQNREKSLLTAEQIFPRRTFGLSGSDAAQITSANVAGQNAWNQADYANQVQQMQFNATGGANAANAAQAQRNANATATAAFDAERNKAILSAAQMVAMLGAKSAGSSSATTTTAGPTPTGWAAGPQPGTYYLPKAA